MIFMQVIALACERELSYIRLVLIFENLHAKFVYLVLVLKIIGLAACNAWARAKHFGCHSVIHSVCYPGMPL